MIEKHLAELKKISSEIIPLTEVSEFTALQSSLMQLSTLKARVNDLIPEIQWLLDDALAQASEKYKDLSATVYKDKIKGELKDYNRVMKFADRIGSTINRASENFRTVVSSMKHEYKQY